MGPANLQFINGAQAIFYATPVQTLNFAASASDIGTFAIASILPPNVTTYKVDSLRIGNAHGSLNAVTVTLYTAASAGGTTVIGSTATTVTSSLPGNTNSYQIIAGPASTMWNSATLFLHVSTSAATANLANVNLAINPVY